MARSMDNQTNSLSFELERGRIMGSSFRLFSSISQRHSSFSSERDRDDEYELKWAAIERLSTVRRMRTSVLDQTVSGDEEQKEKKVVDVSKLGALERRLFVEKLIKHIENDNLRLLQKLYFPTCFPQNLWVQFKACLWKLSLSYWRNPSYNLVRMIFIIITSVVFSALFWKHGKTINNQQDMFNILGSIYIAANFMGTNNCSSILPIILTERTVLYREKFAGMYSSWAYSFAQMVIEIPYVFLQAALFVAITYPAIGYYSSASKFLWFFYTMFCTLLCFVYLGMLLVSLTPNLQVASILSSPCYAIINLFSGFMIPGPKIPKWWIWLYYVSPLSWTLNGLFTSQYGDIHKEITVFGETKSVANFLKDYFGFRHDYLGIVGSILIAYPLIYGFLFGFCIEKLNFQKR